MSVTSQSAGQAADPQSSHYRFAGYDLFKFLRGSDSKKNIPSGLAAFHTLYGTPASTTSSFTNKQGTAESTTNNLRENVDQARSKIKYGYDTLDPSEGFNYGFASNKILEKSEPGGWNPSDFDRAALNKSAYFGAMAELNDNMMFGELRGYSPKVDGIFFPNKDDDDDD